MSNTYFDRQYLRVREVLEMLPVSRSHFYKLIQDGDLPRPIKLGKRTAVWRRSDIAQALHRLNPSRGVTVADLCPVTFGSPE